MKLRPLWIAGLIGKTASTLTSMPGASGPAQLFGKASAALDKCIAQVFSFDMLNENPEVSIHMWSKFCMRAPELFEKAFRARSEEDWEEERRDDG